MLNSSDFLEVIKVRKGEFCWPSMPNPLFCGTFRKFESANTFWTNHCLTPLCPKGIIFGNIWLLTQVGWCWHTYFNCQLVLMADTDIFQLLTCVGWCWHIGLISPRCPPHHRCVKHPDKLLLLGGRRREGSEFFSVFFYLLTLFYPGKLLLPGGRGGLPWRIFSKLLTAETFFIFSNSSS